MNRRQFNKTLSVASLGAAFVPGNLAGTSVDRLFRMSVSPGAIGVSVSQTELLALAHKHGFEAMTADSTEMTSWSASQCEEFVAEMKEKSITWDAAGLPVDFRKSDEIHEEGLSLLPERAKAAASCGVSGMGTWIMPTHDRLSYPENFKQHVTRLRQVANILKDHGLRLGLEYVGPKTLMARDRYAFQRTMKETKDLIAAIGTGNVGFVLDSFHWYCAGETPSDILTLTPEDIVTVDLNDATEGRSPDEQIDNQRQLPLETGLIDAKGFLDALRTVGYAGPVRAEPFNQAVRDLDDDAAMATVKDSMTRAFAL